MKKIISIFIAVLMPLLLCIPAFSSEDLIKPIIIDENSPSDSGYISVIEPEKEYPDGKIFTADYGIQKGETEELPSAYDSRDYGLVTPVKDQGNSGCCWAFGTINALESDAISKGYYTADTADFSEAHLAWYTYTVIDDESNPNNGEGGAIQSETSPYDYGGNWKRAASTLSQGIGIANESEFPFKPYSVSEMGNYGEENRYNQSSGLIIDSAVTLKDQNDIKNWLMEHGSCTAAFCYLSAFYNSSTGSYFCDRDYSTNHLVSIVGWDDNFSVSNFNETYQPTEDGAWLIKDSWGDDARIDGYFWISYEDSSIADFTGYEVRKTDDLYNIYTHTACYSRSYIPVPSGGRVASVYKAESYEKINAVAFTSFTADVTVTIYIYTDLPENYTSPTSGALALTYTETLERAGYNTIDLPSDVIIDKDDSFSIVLNVTSADGSTVNIPLEINKDGTDTQYVFSSGESYYSSSSYASMSDLYNEGYGSVYINALTKCNHQAVVSENKPDCINSGSSISRCSQCGKLLSETYYPANGIHQYGEWSVFEDSEGTNLKERHRACTVCGCIETETILKGSNTVKLEDFFNLIFEHIIGFFKLIFIR